MSQSVEKRIEDLRKQLKEHNYNYYVLNKPTISDPDYDKLLLELESLETQNPQLIIPDSPTQRVGSDLTNQSNLVKHKFLMLSIQNEKDLFKFDSRIRKKLRSTDPVEYIVEAKIDGTSISLEYLNGELIKAATRGDGEFGEDVTENIRTISSVPKKLFSDSFRSYKLDNIIVRGEVFIYIDDFKEMQKEQLEKGEKVFENPRNSAAGILKTKDSKIVAKRPLNIFAYSLLSIYEEFETIEENLSILKKLGFVVNNFAKKCKGIEEVIDACLELEKQRDILPYEIDGAVIKVNSIKTQNALPIRPKSPFWAAAFKFNPMQESTIINGITWQVGRTGAITPVAELEPVKLAGSTIRRATLHNYDEIIRKKIKVGDTVVIEKGGDVIPKVVSVVLNKRPIDAEFIKPPKECPICKSPVMKQEDEVAYYCENPECSAQLKGRLIHFVSRSAMDIEGLGDSIIDQFVEMGLLKSFADIYKLNKKREELINMERFGEKSIDNLLQSIERSKSRQFYKILFALGIRKLGQVGAQTIVDKHKTIDEITNSKILQDIVLLQELVKKSKKINPRSKLNPVKSDKERDKRIEEYQKLLKEIVAVGDCLVESGWYRKNNNEEYVLIDNTGIGPEAAKSVLAFMNSSKGKKIIKELYSIGLFSNKLEEKGSILSGKTFVLTGTLPSLSRPEATKLILDNGGKVASGFSKSADYVLAGEDAGTKLSKSKEAGIKIISESELMDMIKEPNKNLVLTSKKPKPEQLDVF